MNQLRKITLGRSPLCDIVLDGRYIYASQRHGEIFSDGNRMMFLDTSRNGTLVNRTIIRHRAIALSRGDIILVAGFYMLDWNRIDELLSPKTGGSVTAHSIYSVRPIANPNGWNWGAMGIYPLWGLSNGCWWTMPLGILVGILFPLPNLFFGYYGNRLALQSRFWTSAQEFVSEQQRWKWIGIAVMTLLGVLFLWWLCVGLKYVMHR